MEALHLVDIMFEAGWISIWIHNVLEFDIHIGALGAILLIIAGVVLFKRTRNKIKLDRNVGLLGVVTPKEPFRH